jgi:hypothetical protein
MTARSILLAAAVVVAGAATAAAQTNSGFNGTQVNGLFGSNTVGSTTASQNVANSQNIGSGTSAGGNRGTGSAQPNIATSTQNVALSAIEGTRQQTAGAFVGADTADTGNFLSRQNTPGAAGANLGGRSQGMNGLSQLQSLFSQNQQNFNGGQNQARTMPQIRVALRLGFRPQPVSSTRMQTFQTRLTKLPGLRFVGPAEVVMEGRTAILRGKVASQEDRELVEALTKMEPDVLEVKNELEVVEMPETLPSASDVP